jgi:hypothetical protein
MRAQPTPPAANLDLEVFKAPLAHEAGGTEFHPGRKHWMSQDDPAWKSLADRVGGGKFRSGGSRIPL